MRISKLRSYKAEAWRLAAFIIEMHHGYYVPEGETSDSEAVEVLKHIRTVVVESMKRRSQIIERNYHSGK